MSTYYYEYDYTTDSSYYDSTADYTGVTAAVSSQTTSDNCLQYVYLVWVYFLYFVGVGYESSYYPYILSILLDYVPVQCGGTGGTGTESSGLGLDSTLSFLSLIQNDQQGSDSSGQFSIAVQSSNENSSDGGSLAQFGIQEPSVVFPPGFQGRKRREAQSWKASKDKKKRKKESKKSKTKKRKKKLKKNKKKKNSKKDKSTKGNKRKNRIDERKAARKNQRHSERKKSRAKKKEKRKSARRRKLGTSLKKENVDEVRTRFEKGKEKMRIVDRFLDNLQFPFNKKGRLQSGFKKNVREKVYLRLPGLCEESKTESKKKRRECKKRAKRIQRRIRARQEKKKKKIV